MHELPIAKSILTNVLKYAEENNADKVIGVTLQVGELRDFVEDVLQMYWDYIGKGTLAEGSKVNIITVPTSVLCKKCNEVFNININMIDNAICPECGGNRFELFTGRDLIIEDIEISVAV